MNPAAVIAGLVNGMHEVCAIDRAIRHVPKLQVHFERDPLFRRAFEMWVAASTESAEKHR